MIDPTELVLFRVISEDDEEALKIPFNKQMKNFMCLEKSEAELLIEEMNEDASVW